MRRLNRSLVGAGVLALLAAGGYAAADKGAPAGAADGDLCAVGSCEPATVARVIDGDTLDVEAGGKTQRVRVLGIDTPETKKPGEPVDCFGPEATARTEALLPAGAPVTLVTDGAADATDDYGRALRHVTTSAGDNLGHVLVSEGYATTTTFPHSLANAYSADEATARDHGAGFWAACR